MIIGNGDIAHALIEGGVDREDINFFASGVSNSSVKDNETFLKEKLLLSNYNPEKHLVYFSSLCIYYTDTPYALHKKQMEHFIKNCLKSYTIVRIGNVTWGNNRNTIINHFKQCYIKGIQPEIKNTYRHLLTKEEFIYWVKLISPGINDVMNMPGEMVYVNEIWRRVCNGEY